MRNVLNRCLGLSFGLLTATFAATTATAGSPGPVPGAPPLTLPQTPNGGYTGHDWSGFYLGGFVGGMALSVNQSDLTNTFLNDPPSQSDIGAVGGVYLGYNYALGERAIIGAELDYSTGVGIDEFVSSNAAGTTGQKYTNDIQSIMSIRARAGITAGDSMMYVTGGYASAQGKFEALSINRNTGATSCANSTCASVDEKFDGLVIGAGAEHAIRENIILRFEIMHYAFQDIDAAVETAGLPACAGGPTGVCNFNFDPSMTQIRVGVSFSF
jgi:outer membrane immunogenic protein